MRENSCKAGGGRKRRHVDVAFLLAERVASYSAFQTLPTLKINSITACLPCLFHCKVIRDCKPTPPRRRWWHIRWLGYAQPYISHKQSLHSV
jgi:hypothetical protein